jgi:hypothetical protein
VIFANTGKYEPILIELVKEILQQKAILAVSERLASTSHSSPRHVAIAS